MKADLAQQERRMWDDMRREWPYIDKIYVTVEEFDQLKRVRLDKDAMSAVAEALFHPGKRMFLGDIAFIVSAGDDLRRIIWLNYHGDDAASIVIFDGDGRLFGKCFVRIENNDVKVGPDLLHPIGVRYFERYVREHLPAESIHPRERKRLEKEIERAVTRRMMPRLEEIVLFVIAAIHHVLYTVEVREVAPAREKPKRRSASRSASAPAFRPPRKLHRIIYEGDQRPQRSGRTFTQRVDSWRVRGHYRTYKDGKHVWVKPHVKGRKSEKFRPLGAEYRL